MDRAAQFDARSAWRSALSIRLSST
jgi:hypothetical protein